MSNVETNPFIAPTRDAAFDGACRLFVSALGAALGVAISCSVAVGQLDTSGGQSRNANPAGLALAHPKRIAILRPVSRHGWLEPCEDSKQNVGAPVGGTVTGAFVRPGAIVRRGDPLFEIDSEAVARISMDWKNAENAAAGLQALASWRAVRVQAHDPNSLGGPLPTGSRMLVFAPVDGVVERLNLSPVGAEPSGSSPSVDLFDPAKLCLSTTIPETSLVHLRPGRRVQLDVVDKPVPNVAAILAAIGPALKLPAAEIEAVIEVDNRHGSFSPGDEANFSLPTTGSIGGLAIAKQALAVCGDRTGVWISSHGSSPRWREIILGSETGSSIEVLSGLTEADFVVTPLEPGPGGADRAQACIPPDADHAP